MCASGQKTRSTDQDVDAFLAAIPDETKRRDARQLRDMMEDVSGEPARMWGDSIIGCGTYHYRYASGHEGDTHVVGFAPRSRNLAVYIAGGLDEQRAVLDRLGKHKLGKGCLYIARLADVNVNVLSELVAGSVRAGRRLDTTDPAHRNLETA